MVVPFGTLTDVKAVEVLIIAKAYVPTAPVDNPAVAEPTCDDVGAGADVR